MVDVTSLDPYDYIIPDPDNIGPSEAVTISPPKTPPVFANNTTLTTKSNLDSSNKSDTNVNEQLLCQCFVSNMAAIPPTVQVNPFGNPYIDNIYYISEDGLTEY